MAFSRPNRTRFDVFLNFRGKDTRDSFTDHLYAALKKAGIFTFRDNDEIRRGLDLELEIVKAIKDSKASIVVLSKNYAKSRWCLGELLLILEQRQKCNHFVLPVFYHVDPSDVRNQRQSFTIETKDEVEGSKWTVVNVNRWKTALTKVANLTGIVASGSEIELIAKIVNIIDYELDLKLISTPHLTGLRRSGKTMLAQNIYSYYEEIGKHYKEPYTLPGPQKRLLTDVLEGKDERVSCFSEGTSKRVDANLSVRMRLREQAKLMRHQAEATETSLTDVLEGQDERVSCFSVGTSKRVDANLSVRMRLWREQAKLRTPG